MLEWTPESLKAEVDYRRGLAARHAREARATQRRTRSHPWWTALLGRRRDSGTGDDPTGGEEHDVAA